MPNLTYEQLIVSQLIALRIVLILILVVICGFVTCDMWGSAVVVDVISGRIAVVAGARFEVQLHEACGFAACSKACPRQSALTGKSSVVRPCDLRGLTNLLCVPSVPWVLLVWCMQVIDCYLDRLIFPDTMEHRGLKLAANGQDVGGDMLFDVKLGFSGTPSDLLPLELGRLASSRHQPNAVALIVAAELHWYRDYV